MTKKEIEWAIYTLSYHNKHFETKGSGVYQAIELALEIMRKESRDAGSIDSQGEKP